MKGWLRAWFITTARYYWHRVRLHRPRAFGRPNGEEGFWCTCGAKAAFGAYRTERIDWISREVFEGKWPMQWHLRVLQPAATASALAGHLAMAGWMHAWPVTKVTIFYPFNPGEFYLEVEIARPVNVSSQRHALVFEQLFSVVEAYRPAGARFGGYMPTYSDREELV